MVQLFDCNATVGRLATPVLGNVLSVSGLLEEMDTAGIQKALVSHAFAKELDYREGNRLTLESASVSERLYPLGTLLAEPSTARDHADTFYLRDLIQDGCGGIKIHPDPTHHIMDQTVYGQQFPFSEHALLSLFTEMERYRVALFIEMPQVTWTEIFDTCRNHPSLPVVLLNVSYTDKRSLLLGFEQFNNLYCDTSGYHAYRGLEEVCNLFGSGRMLFGTRLPWYSAIASIAMLLYSDLSYEHKSAIGHANLEALLAGVTVDVS